MLRFKSSLNSQRCMAECTVGVLCDSDILSFLEVCNSDAVVWVGESEGKAWIESRENVQDIGVDVLIRLQVREVKKDFNIHDWFGEIFSCLLGPSGLLSLRLTPLGSFPLLSLSLQTFTI